MTLAGGQAVYYWSRTDVQMYRQFLAMVQRLFRGEGFKPDIGPGVGVHNFNPSSGISL